MNPETKKAVAELKKTDAALAKCVEEHIESFTKHLVESGKFTKDDNLLRSLEKLTYDGYIAGYNQAKSEYEDKLSCIL